MRGCNVQALVRGAAVDTSGLDHPYHISQTFYATTGKQFYLIVCTFFDHKSWEEPGTHLLVSVSVTHVHVYTHGTESQVASTCAFGACAVHYSTLP